MIKYVHSDKAPAAVGPYSLAVELNGTVYVSGQLPINPATGTMPDSVDAQTRQAIENISSILAAAGFSLADVVKTTVILADMADFAAMNAAYAVFFKDSKPARVCFQAAALPKNAKVEIDAIAGK